MRSARPANPAAATCFHPSPSLWLPSHPRPCLALCSRSHVPCPPPPLSGSLMSPPLTRMQVAKWQLSSRELRTSLVSTTLRLPCPRHHSHRATSRFSEETKLPETPTPRQPSPRPPPPFNLEKFQRVQISGALERTDWPQYRCAKTKDRSFLSLVASKFARVITDITPLLICINTRGMSLREP